MFPQKHKIILLVIAIVLILAGIVWFRDVPPPADENIVTIPPNWIATTTSTGVSFSYPENLATTYMHTVDWPPQIAVMEDSLSCTEAGDVTARAGRTESRTINGRVYCVTEISEGAAGSIYVQYAYATEIGSNKVVILTFTIRAVQCANYDEPNKSECEVERETFDIDSVVDKIVQTI